MSAPDSHLFTPSPSVPADHVRTSSRGATATQDGRAERFGALDVVVDLVGEVLDLAMVDLVRVEASGLRSLARAGTPCDLTDVAAFVAQVTTRDTLLVDDAPPLPSGGVAAPLRLRMLAGVAVARPADGRPVVLLAGDVRARQLSGLHRRTLVAFAALVGRVLVDGGEADRPGGATPSEGRAAPPSAADPALPVADAPGSSRFAVLRGAFAALPSPVVCWRRDGTVRFANPAAAAWFGHPGADLVGWPMAALLGPVEMATARPTREAVLAGVTQRQEVRGGQPGGPPDAQLFDLVADRDRDGTVVGYLALATAVAPISPVVPVVPEVRHVAHAAHGPGGDADAAGGDAALQVSAPMMMHAIDLDGRIVKVTDRWLQVLGYVRDDVIGRPITDVLDAPSATVFRTRCRPQVLATGCSSSNRMALCRADGSLVEAWIASVLVRDDAGRPDHVVVFVEPVAAPSAPGRFDMLARLGDDLRTPLHAVLGFTQLLRLDPDATLSPRQLLSVEHIETSARQLTRLLEDLMELRRLEAEGIDVVPGDFALDPLVAEVVAHVRGAAAGAGVDIAATSGGDPPLRVHADAARLRQALVTLVSLAAQASGTGGSVRVSCRAHLDGRIALSVHGSGIAIGADRLAALLVQDDAAANEPTSLQAGAELGLEIVKALVARMGGALLGRAEPGEGMQVTMLLPRADDAVG